MVNLWFGLESSGKHLKRFFSGQIRVSWADTSSVGSKVDSRASTRIHLHCKQLERFTWFYISRPEGLEKLKEECHEED